MPIEVELARIGERVEKFALPDGATVADLLEAAEVELYEGETLQINGSRVSEDTKLYDGQRVFIVPPATLEKPPEILKYVSEEDLKSNIFITGCCANYYNLEYMGRIFCTEDFACYHVLRCRECGCSHWVRIDCESCSLQGTEACPLRRVVEDEE